MGIIYPGGETQKVAYAFPWMDQKKSPMFSQTVTDNNMWYTLVMCMIFRIVHYKNQFQDQRPPVVLGYTTPPQILGIQVPHVQELSQKYGPECCVM